MAKNIKKKINKSLQSTPDKTSTTLNNVEKWCNDNKTDIFIYSGSIGSDNSNSFLSERFIDTIIEKSNNRENCLLFLTSFGGSADWAYKIVSALKTKYKKYDIVVCGYCKSAATLITLGANELFFSNKGELGPLDVQTRKKDDFFSRQSPLDVFKSEELISDWALSFFEKSFLKILNNGGGVISIDVASSIAHKLSESLFAPIMGKINPLEVGEIARSMHVANGYGDIIKSNNVKPDTLQKLIILYSCHSFVIDMKQAKDLFERVNELNEIQI
ncbi:MAG: hypothetical protein LBU68_01520 [Rickettsiales bacterium]|jgi:hypothetical protein|nr:hypothetical protein [Rickettsiales bacterium]